MPPVDPNDTIVIAAESAQHWIEGNYEVWLLNGDCLVQQGTTATHSQQAVLWVKQSGEFGARENRVIGYFEGDVGVDYQRGDAQARMQDESWLGDFYSTSPLRIHVAHPGPEPPVKPAVYQHALARREPAAAGAIQRTQYTTRAAPALTTAPAGTRRLRAFPLTGTPVQSRWYPNPQRNEWVAVIHSGVNLIIDGLQDFGTLDIAAENMVIWTAGAQEPSLQGQTLQSDDTPLEIYMEGNIVFREGKRVIHANRMYYDVRNRVGMVIDAEILTPVPQFEGLLRLKADVIQQTSQDQFYAQQGYITASRLGEPTYRLQASSVYLEDQQIPFIDPITGAPQLDPETGEQVFDSQRQLTSYNNVLFLGPAPVFYWPVFATDLTEPSFFLRHIRVKNDRIFGNQFLTDWDAYQLLGIRNRPEGTDLNLSVDYMDKRGFGGGLTFRYDRFDLFDVPGRYAGFIDAWAINDHGRDNLGSGRSSVIPDKTFRYRTLARHRQDLPNNFQLSGEVGLISDRNFLEQYYEVEWDQYKDQTTGFELKRLDENSSWSVTSDARINDFFTQTEWYPRLDHFWLGQPLLGDRIHWFEHTSVGYADLEIASRPTSPQDLRNFTYMPWEVPSKGERVATRQELNMAFPVGPVKMVPYALGEAAHWGQDLTGDDLQRLYGQVGVKASIPFWSVNPNAESGLFNVHGLAHKIVLDGEFSFAESNRALDLLPLYDPVDDDVVEHFRRRFTTITFPGVVPQRFDERFYALRYGSASWVTSPATEIADDLMAVRMGARQRWQTKRGQPGQRRILDWITLDTQMTFFPKEDRDNYGESIGLANYDFRWHVGDRVTLLSDGIFDFFDEGQQLVSVGAFLRRPPRGSLYVGFRVLEGPISSHVLTSSFSYRMSPKWISSLGTTVDVGGNGNIGQFLTITRVGESFLFSAGMNVDANKDNTGINISVEPRFLSGRLGRAGGARVPPAGAYGLE